MSQRRKCVWLLINAIICYVIAGLYLFSIVAYAFNLFGVMDLYAEVMSSIYPNYAGQIDMSMMYLQIGIDVLISISFGNFYLTGYRHRFYSREYAARIILNSVLGLLCGLFIPSVIGLIIAGVMKSKSSYSHNEVNVDKSMLRRVESEIPQGKLIAMSEAVERLKQLREKGVISEEEYYTNLNKILEG